MTHGVLAPQRSTFTSRVTVNGSRGVAWERPADWLPVPVPSASDQRFVGLAAVFNNGANFITVRSGVAFKVDWGDGAGWVNYAANTTAEKNLAWSDYSSGTLTSRGYRQALVTVEAQSGNLTSLDLQQRHSSVPRAVATAWLDVAVSLPSGTLTFGGWNVYQSNVERVTIVGVANTNFTAMFQYCYSLQSVPLLNTTNGTNFTAMFQECSSLQSVPLFNTANGTGFANMFNGCPSLQSVPALNTANGTNFSSMFYNCFSLQSAPALNTANGTNFASMFQYCYSLQSAALNGTRYSIDYSNAMLSPAELDAIYTALGTAAGAQTITVTGNWGTATDTPSIATAKGWTVAGS